MGRGLIMCTGSEKEWKARAGPVKLPRPPPNDAKKFAIGAAVLRSLQNNTVIVQVLTSQTTH